MRSISAKLFLGMLVTLCSGYVSALAQASPVLKVNTLPQQSLSLVITGGQIQNLGSTSELNLDLQSKSYESLQHATIAVYLYRNAKLLGGEGIPVNLPANKNISEILHPHFSVKSGDHVLVLIQDVKSGNNNYAESPDRITNYLKFYPEHLRSGLTDTNTTFQAKR